MSQIDKRRPCQKQKWQFVSGSSDCTAQSSKPWSTKGSECCSHPRNRWQKEPLKACLVLPRALRQRMFCVSLCVENQRVEQMVVTDLKQKFLFSPATLPNLYFHCCFVFGVTLRNFLSPRFHLQALLSCEKMLVWLLIHLFSTSPSALQAPPKLDLKQWHHQEFRTHLQAGCSGSFCQVCRAYRGCDFIPVCHKSTESFPKEHPSCPVARREREFRDSAETF